LEYLEKAKKALDSASIEPTAATPVEVSAAAAEPEDAAVAPTAPPATPVAPPREIRAAA
jgi:hypothetical protein